MNVFGSTRPWRLAALLVLTWDASAGAQEAAAAGREAAPAVSAGPALRGPSEASVVVLALRGDPVDVARLRALLRAELGHRVVLEHEPRPSAVYGVLTLSYQREAAELAVAWDSGGQTVTRVIPAPSPELVASDGAMLAGNLARQQVDDLLPAQQPVALPAALPPELPAPAPIVPAADVAPERRPVTLGIFYPLASHHGHGDVISSFDLNLMYGRVGSIDGAQLGGVNVVSRERRTAFVWGLQAGYVANLVDGELHGVQLAGIFNQVSADTEGAQFAFGANLARGAVRGLQSALLFNRSGDLQGLQLSAVNVAGDVDGVQLGLINVARRVRGVSIGLINIAEDIDGLPLAPFSVTSTGGVHPSAWSGTSGWGNVGVKLATRYTYTLLFGSYHRAFDLDFLGGGFGIGGSVRLGAGFRSDIDVSATYLVAPALASDPSRESGYHEQLLQPRLRVMLGFRAARHLGAFVGVAALGQVRAELGWDRTSVQVGPEIFGGIEL